MTNIAIIGAGWLGEPLARRLNFDGNQCIVTKRTQEGLDSLSGLSGFICNLDKANAEDELVSQLKQNNIHTVVGSFPPGFRKGNGDEYVNWWRTLVNASVSAGITKLVMISSTTVYPAYVDVMTEDKASYKLATEDPQFSDKARLMLQAEKLVEGSGLTYAIVRLSGLFGPNRNPARFIAKLKSLSQSAPANMLHLDDAIGATCFACSKIENEIVNATTPETVSKAEFYAKAAELAGHTTSLPEIVDIKDKKISPEKLLSLGYRFKYQHIYEGLDAL